VPKLPLCAVSAVFSIAAVERMGTAATYAVTAHSENAVPRQSCQMNSRKHLVSYNSYCMHCCLHRHVLVTRPGVWIDSWIYSALNESELQVIIMLSLIRAPCFSLQHTLSLLSFVALAVARLRFAIVENLLLAIISQLVLNCRLSTHAWLVESELLYD
jgi:hypothetical protein